MVTVGDERSSSSSWVPAAACGHWVTTVTTCRNNHNVESLLRPDTTLSSLPSQGKERTAPHWSLAPEPQLLMAPEPSRRSPEVTSWRTQAPQDSKPTPPHPQELRLAGRDGKPSSSPEAPKGTWGSGRPTPRFSRVGGIRGGRKENVDLPGTCPVPSQDLIWRLIKEDAYGHSPPTPRVPVSCVGAHVPVPANRARLGGCCWWWCLHLGQDSERELNAQT